MKTALLFPGQGSQRVGMGRDLAQKFAVARQVFDEADAALGYPISKICFDGPEDALTLTASLGNADQAAVDVLALDELLASLHKLDERAAQIVELRYFGGYEEAEIARMLGLSERTVRSHVSTILGKLQLSSRTQATLYALRNGLARLEEEG